MVRAWLVRSAAATTTAGQRDLVREITDELMREMLAKSKAYTLMTCRAGPAVE